jgi:nitroreductase
MTPLEQAARAARHAPSIFNTQPWSWRITGRVMELFADRSRQVESIDPDGRLLLLSCGAALHHARVALNAAGWAARVERLPDPQRPELLARITLGGTVQAAGTIPSGTAPSGTAPTGTAPTGTAPTDPENKRMAAAMKRRRTDRRAFGDRTVPEAELTKLRRFVEYEGAYLHVVRPDQIAALAVDSELAAATELDDPVYRADLHRWTNRPTQTGDGVPPDTAVQPELRRVPLRDFFPDAGAGLEAGPAHDRGAAFVVLFGNGVARIELLHGGEALSALLLLATADGLATAPLSDAVEVAWPRHLLRGLLSGVGEPYLVVRLGYVPGLGPVPAAPRRAPHDVITVTG